MAAKKKLLLLDEYCLTPCICLKECETKGTRLCEISCREYSLEIPALLSMQCLSLITSEKDMQRLGEALKC